MKSVVSDPVGTAAKAVNAIGNAVVHPVSTAVNAAKSVANAVTSFVNEVKAPASAQPVNTPYTPTSVGYSESKVTSSESVSPSGQTNPTYTASPYVESPVQNSGYVCNSKGNYLSRSLIAFVFGNYSDAEPTWLSVGGSIAAGFFNADLPLDIRDFVYDVSHIGELKRPVLQIGVDSIAFLPLIGALKYVDDVADAAKQADKISDALDGIGDVVKQADRIGDTADIGRKIEYAMGNATGSVENIHRSLEMERTLNSIGIFDNKEGRDIVEGAFYDAFKSIDNGLVDEDTGRIVVESLLEGPNGFAKMQTIWDGNKLVTINIFKTSWNSIG